MESNYVYSLFFKHIFLVVSIILVFSGVRGYVVEDSIMINGEPGELSLGGLIFLTLLGSIFAILWNYLRQRMIRVRLGGQNITIINSEEEIIVPWTEIKALKRVPFVVPPLYKIKTQEDGPTFLFINNPLYLDFGFGIYDMTKMGRFIRKKRKELNL